MTATLTLVARSGLPEAARNASEALRGLGAQVGEHDWLADDLACDVPFDGPDLTAAGDAVRRALGSEPIDLAVQDARGRRKRLLVADMESTLIRNEMLNELAVFAGCREQVEEVTARAMNGELDFEAAMKERVSLLAGLSVAVLEQTLDGIEVNPGAACLVATMRAHGATTAIASGGFNFYTSRVREHLGLDVDEANELEIVDGKLTGRVVEPARGREAKRETLEKLCRELGVAPEDAAAVGDGANDLAMLAAAGLGVAYHAKPIVAQAARFRVDHGDLTALLYFQGYRQAEFRSS